MDLILYNANIYTMDDSNPKAEAIAIKNGLVYQIGNNEDILKLASINTVTINMKGQTIIPGFNDSHLHLYMTGKLLSWINLLNAKSLQEVLDKVSKEINSKDLKVFMGHGWNQDYFTDSKRFITKDDLDKVSTTKPIILYRACGHIAVVNSKALELFNISSDINLNDGRLDFKTGIFYENALDIITKNLPTPSIEEIKSILKKAIKHANINGITSVQSDDFFTTDAGYSPIIKAYLELEQENELNLRVYEQSLLMNINTLSNFINDGYYTGWGSNLFKIGPLKLIGDGSLGARTAAMRNEYKDDEGNFGILTNDDNTLYELIKTAHLNNLQIAIHAIGDKTMEQALKLYEKVLNEYPKDDHRHGVVHCQVMDINQIDKFKDLDLIAYVQPIFVHYDQRIIESRVGKTLSETSYAFKTMIDKGINVAIGTDSPIEELNPINNIYCAVTRKTLDGNLDGWNTKECLSVYEAVKHYTVYSSFASFDENIKGKLLPNYLADLTILDNNIFECVVEEIKNTKVNMTILGGNIVYNRFL